MGLANIGTERVATIVKAQASNPVFSMASMLKMPEVQLLLKQMNGRDPREVNRLIEQFATKHPEKLAEMLQTAAAKNPKVQGAISQFAIPTDSLSLSQVARKLTQARPVATPVSGTLAHAVIPQATRHNAVTFHFTPEASHEALLDSIRGAKKSYFIETFIWHNDEAGHDVLKALADKKISNPEFDIKVLLDGFGLRQGSGGHDDSVMVDKLRKIGADVLEYQPTWHSAETKQAVPFSYTHRKLYIADGEQFITGGRNIGNEYLKPNYQVADKGVLEPSWHDMLYTVRGDETGRILDEFAKNWERAGGHAPAVMPTVVPHPTGQARIQSFTTDPIAGTFGLWDAQSRSIQNAKTEIIARYPYFSDDELVAELIRAKKARPELDVKVILPANKEASHEGDVYAALNKVTAGQLHEAGIQVRMFEGGLIDGKPVQRFSHMKAMSVDGELLSVGSANADARTFNGNHELNTFIIDRKTTSVFNEQALNDWAASKPFLPADLLAASPEEAQKYALLEAADFLL